MPSPRPTSTTTLAHDVRYAAPGDVLGPHLADPGQRNGDIRLVVTRHTPLHVSVMTKFRDLRRVGHVKHWYVVRGPRRTDRVVLSATRGHRSGQLTVRRYQSGRLVPFPGAIWRIDYRENRTRVILPVQCFKSPRWGQIASGWWDRERWQRGDDARSSDYDIHTLDFGKRLYPTPLQ